MIAHAWHTSRLLQCAAVVSLLILSILFVGVGAKNALLPSGSHDLQWTPSRDLIAGVNPYENFIQWRDDGHELTPPHFLNQSPSYPASAYVLLSPIALLDWPAAKITWLAINLSLIALIIVALQRTFPINSPILLFVVVAIFLCCTPLRASLGAGQLNLLSVAAFLWSYYFSQKNDTGSVRLSGALLAVAWIKYSLTFPLSLIFINQKNWRPILIAAAIHSLLTIIAALRLNLWPHEFFFSSVEVVLMGHGTGFLNLSALAMKLHLPTTFALCAICTAMLATGIQISRMQRTDPLPLLALLALFSCAVFFHHEYDFVVLILLAWCMAQRKLSAVATFSSASLLAFSWAGLWLAQEVQPALGIFGSAICTMAEVLMVAAFYSTLVLLANHLSHKRALTNRVLAF